MIGDIKAFIEILQELFDLSRKDRRIQQDILINRLKPLHKQIHNHYLLSFTKVLNQFRANEMPTREVLYVIKEFESQNQGDRDEIKILLNSLVKRKWNEKNQRLLQYIREYFDVKIELFDKYSGNSDFSYSIVKLLDYRDYKSKDLVLFLQHAIDFHPRRSAFSYLESLFRAIDSLGQGSGSNGSELLKNDIEKVLVSEEIDMFFNQNKDLISRQELIEFCTQLKNVEFKRKIIMDSLEKVTDYLQKKWRKCLTIYIEIDEK